MDEISQQFFRLQNSLFVDTLRWREAVREKCPALEHILTLAPSAFMSLDYSIPSIAATG